MHKISQMLTQWKVRINLILSMGSTIRHRNRSSTEIKTKSLDQRIEVIYSHLICFAWSPSFRFLTGAIDFERFYTKENLKEHNKIGNCLLVPVTAHLKGWTISQLIKDPKGRTIIHLITITHEFSRCKSEAVFTHLFNCLWVNFYLLSLAGFNKLKAAQDTFEHVGLQRKGKGKSTRAFLLLLFSCLL